MCKHENLIIDSTASFADHNETGEVRSMTLIKCTACSSQWASFGQNALPVIKTVTI